MKTNVIRIFYYLWAFELYCHDICQIKNRENNDLSKTSNYFCNIFYPRTYVTQATANAIEDGK